MLSYTQCAILFVLKSLSLWLPLFHASFILLLGGPPFFTMSTHAASRLGKGFSMAPKAILPKCALSMICGPFHILMLWDAAF